MTGGAVSGVVVAEVKARGGRGPVLAVIERADEAAAILEAARRLAASSRTGLVVVPFAGALINRVEAEAAALAANEMDVVIERGDVRDVAGVSALARRRRCGFLVAGFGGRLAGGEAEICRLAAMIECPVLLIGGTGRRKAA